MKQIHSHLSWFTKGINTDKTKIRGWKQAGYTNVVGSGKLPKSDQIRRKEHYITSSIRLQLRYIEHIIKDPLKRSRG